MDCTTSHPWNTKLLRRQMSGRAWTWRGPMMMGHAQQQIPSANRAGLLSLQSLCFRLSFVCTGPLIGMLADRVGVQQTFLWIGLGFALVLPPVVWLFLRQLGRDKRQQQGAAEALSL